MSDLQSLKDFLVLSRFKSFSKAAEHCHVTTSGLSRRIQNLELWLGSPVFDRSKHQLEFTDAGRQLHQVASEVVTALDAVKNSVRRQAAAEQDQIRLAAPHIMSSVFFPDWLSRLHTQFGQAKFTVASSVLPDCLRGLDSGDVDFVVTFDDAGGGILDHLGRRDGWLPLQALELGQELLVPVSAPGIRGDAVHKLTGSPQRTVSYLGYADECSVGWALQRALASMPSLPAFAREHENSLAEGLRSMALIGMGLAWLPESLVRQDLATRRLVRAGGPACDVALSVRLLRKSQRIGRRAEALWQRLQQELAEQPDPAAVATLRAA